MPNYVKNIVEFDCSPECLKEILAAIQYDPSPNRAFSGPGTIDFNKLIPVPDSLNIECGSRTTQGLKYYRDFVDVYQLGRNVGKDELLSIPNEREQAFLKNRPDIDAETWKLGKTAFQNILRYGSPTWYEFCTRNDVWATKWNSLYCEYDPVHENCIEFQTAWSAPHPVLAKLSSLFPEVHITHQWADEDIGSNCGSREYRSGAIIAEFIPEIQKECLEFAASVWDADLTEDYGLYLNADGTNYVSIDDEEYEAIEILGKQALFTNERITGSDIPEGMYHYDLRESDDGERFCSVEPVVKVNHSGSIIMHEPLQFGHDSFIALNDDTSPDFTGEKQTIAGFMKPNDISLQMNTDCENQKRGMTY